MLDLVALRGIAYQTVLMDSWYATTQIMTRLINAGKLFYCPIKKNRKVDDSGGQSPYVAVEKLAWTPQEKAAGKTVKVHGFAGATHLKLFRVSFSTERTEYIRTEYIVTNDDTQDDAADAQQESARRWKVEQFHREAKQLTGIERCECRLNHSQRNHICTSVRVWVCLKSLAYQTVYQTKKGLLSDYLRQQPRQPTIAFA